MHAQSPPSFIALREHGREDNPVVKAGKEEFRNRITNGCVREIIARKKMSVKTGEAGLDPVANNKTFGNWLLTNYVCNIGGNQQQQQQQLQQLLQQQPVHDASYNPPAVVAKVMQQQQQQQLQQLQQLQQQLQFTPPPPNPPTFTPPVTHMLRLDGVLTSAENDKIDDEERADIISDIRGEVEVSERASFEEDEHTRDEFREIATGIMATSTTKLN